MSVAWLRVLFDRIGAHRVRDPQPSIRGVNSPNDRHHVGAHTPPTLGAHGLGPHVVGARVVVRRVVPGRRGPTGGPALTDVLGVAEQWEPSLVVRRDDGTTVEIPHALIISGKPVPPRRHPALRITAADAQRRIRALWGGEREEMGAWLLQASAPAPHLAGRAGSPGPVTARLRRRSNSALAYGAPDRRFEDAAQRVVDWYADRGRVPLAAVELGSDSEQALRDLGWSEPDDLVGTSVSLQIASFSRVRRALARALASSRASLDAVELSRVATSVTARGPVGGGAIELGEDGAVHDWACVHDLHTEPAERRRGHAYAVLAALLEPAAERGVTTLALHVVASNVAAVTLFERLGFVEHHTSTYLTPR